MTTDQLRYAIAALPMPEGWTPADDVALVEASLAFRNVTAIAMRIRKPRDVTERRLMQLTRAASGGNAMTWADQERLVDAVREMA